MHHGIEWETNKADFYNGAPVSFQIMVLKEYSNSLTHLSARFSAFSMWITSFHLQRFVVVVVVVAVVVVVVVFVIDVFLEDRCLIT